MLKSHYSNIFLVTILPKPITQTRETCLLIHNYFTRHNLAQSVGIQTASALKRAILGVSFRTRRPVPELNGIAVVSTSWVCSSPRDLSRGIYTVASTKVIDIHHYVLCKSVASLPITREGFDLSCVWTPSLSTLWPPFGETHPVPETLQSAVLRPSFLNINDLWTLDKCPSNNLPILVLTNVLATNCST